MSKCVHVHVQSLSVANTIIISVAFFKGRKNQCYIDNIKAKVLPLGPIFARTE